MEFESDWSQILWTYSMKNIYDMGWYRACEEYGGNYAMLRLHLSHVPMQIPALSLCVPLECQH